MTQAIAGPVAGAVVGGLLGGGSSSGGTQTTSKEPWSAVQPWLQNQITTGQNLQDYYQSHPLNSMQQQGYQNLAGSLDNWNSNVAPSLQNVANNLMGSNYQRTIGQQTYSQPSLGGGMGQGMGQARGNFQGMNPGMSAGQMASSYQGVQAQPMARPQLDVTQGQTPYGQLDFASLLPDVNKLNAAASSKKPSVNQYGGGLLGAILGADLSNQMPGGA